MKKIFLSLLILLTAATLFSACGGDNGPGPLPTKAVLKLSTSGTLQGSTSIIGIGVSITFPNGIKIKTGADGNVDDTVITPSGVTAGAAIITSLYTAATATAPGKFNFVLTSTAVNGFGTGEFVAVNCDISSGNPKSADFSTSNFSPIDLYGQPISGLTLGFTADIH